MQTIKRICLEDLTIKDRKGNSVTLNKGEEYITSPEIEGKVMVFTTYWVWVEKSFLSKGEVFTET